jgi:hypothetical protein
MINKRKIIYVLVSFVSILLLLNVVLGITKKNHAEKPKESLSIDEIELNFYNTLNEFGIQQSWVQKQKLKKGTFDSLTYKFNVKLPSGVAIPVVIKDLNESFIGKPVSITSEEKKINGYTSLKIESGNYTKLITELRYDSQLFRENSQIGFLITDLEDTESSDFSTLKKLAIPFGCILPLELKSTEIAEILKSNGIDYFVNLYSDSENTNFELDKDFDLEKLSQNIRNIISSFNSPKIFLIDLNESGFDHNLKNFIIDEFNKRNRKIIPLNNYVLLKGENEKDLISLMNFHLNNVKAGESKVFKISVSDFFKMQDEITRYIKRGNKVITPSKLI